MNFGPGTELKRLLHNLRIQSTPTCLCDQRAMIMDEEGSKWCRDNIPIIIEWMKEEAENRKLPFIAMAAKLLVLRAIRNSEKKARMMRS